MKANYKKTENIFEGCNFIYVYNFNYSNVYGQFAYYKKEPKRDDCVGMWNIKYLNK